MRQLGNNSNLLVDIILVLNSLNDEKNFDSITARAKAHEVLKAVEKEEKVVLAPTLKKGVTNTLVRTESNMSSRSVRSSAITVT